MARQKDKKAEQDTSKTAEAAAPEEKAAPAEEQESVVLSDSDLLDVEKQEVALLQKDNDALVKIVEELQDARTQELAQIQSLKDALSELKASKGKGKKDEDFVVLDGKRYKILLVEEAKELILCIQRSEVEDDRTVVVVDRIGA